MTDTVKSWIEERRAIHRKRHVKRSAWSEATRDWAVEFPRALDALEQVLELHRPYRYYEHEDTCPNHDEDHRAERHVEFEIGEYYCEDRPTDDIACTSCRDSDGELMDWPCDEYQKLQEAINDD